MTIKRFILGVLTIFAILRVLLSLGDSFTQPQIQSRLELYQTDLLLHATEISNEDLISARDALVGANPLAAAEEQYLKARQVTNKSLANFQGQLQTITSQPASLNSQSADLDFLGDGADVSPQELQLQQVITETNQFIAQIDLKLGIIQAQQGETAKALSTWEELIVREKGNNSTASIYQTAEILRDLWQESNIEEADVESILVPDADLNGWFRYTVKKQFYSSQQREDDLLNLEAKEREQASIALVKLVLIGTIPLLGGIVGVGLLVFLLVQWFLKQDKAILNLKNMATWPVPWDGEIVWQVLIVGFFFIGQLVIPLLLGFLGLNLGGLSLRFQAGYILVTYLLLALGGLSVLYFSIKPFFPLPSEWFSVKWLGNWFVWGLGGYLVALPLVVLVSLINQQFWQGQGGSNPILFLALQAQDTLALAIFFITASVAAPIFEELVFRGFLLPSLTRYLPVGRSILLSSFIFSAAHLSLSEVFPLMTLGVVLGFVYMRSRNLLAPILLHCLWNSGTLFSLFVLGSGV